MFSTLARMMAILEDHGQTFEPTGAGTAVRVWVPYSFTADDGTVGVAHWLETAHTIADVYALLGY